MAVKFEPTKIFMNLKTKIHGRRWSVCSKLPFTLLALALSLALPSAAWATANYVYHERTVNDPGCGGQYVTTLTPNSGQPYPLRWKIEYQNYTTQTRVYYTTDGSAPTGAVGVASGTTTVISGAYACTFVSGGVVDVASATIPAQPPGTVVNYVIGAWHSGGGPEIFANSGEFVSPFTNSAAATVFTYTVSSTPQPSVLIESRTSAGALTANPPYLETGTWSDSSSKSTASGGLVASGSRFATNGTPNFRVTPTLTVGVTYAVESTLAAASASADLVAAIATTGTSASTLPATTTAFQTARGNLWTLLGTITASATTPTVTFTYSSGTINPVSRFYADAVRFIPVTAAGVKTWNGGGATNFWTTGLNWGGTQPNPGGGDVLVFNGNTSTNALMDGPFTVNAVSFSSGATNFTLAGVGGSLTLTTAGITNNSPFDQFISLPIAQGATALNVNTGTSTNQVILSGLLTGTGGYSASGSGVLYITNPANSITGPVTVGAGATLRLPAGSSIGGTGSGAGDITLNGGTFRNDDATAGGSFVTANRSLPIGAGGGTLRVNSGAQVLVYSGNISGAGNTLTFVSGGSGNGELRITTNATIANGGHFTFGKLVIDTGVYSIGTSSTSGSEDSLGAVPGVTTDDAITLRNNGRLRNLVSPLTLNVNRGITLGTGGGTIRAASSANLTIPAAIKGNNQLTIGGTDTGTVIISNTANSFGNVTIATGSLKLGAAGVVPDTSGVALSSSTSLDLSGFSETVRAVTGSAGTIILGTGGTLIASNVSPSVDAFSSSITGTGGTIVKRGTGTWNITGATGWGNLRIEDGVYGVGGVNGMGDGILTIAGGKIASTSGTSRSPVTSAVFQNGDVTLGDSVNTGNLTFSATCPWILTNANRAITVDTITATISGVISDDGSPRTLNKLGGGTLTLGGNNTFTGNLTNSAGAISIGGTVVTPFGSGTGTIVLSGGNIVVTADRGTSANNIVNPLLLTASSELQAATTTGTRNLTFGGALTGTAGTLTLHNTSASAGPGTFNVRFTNGFTFNRPISSVVDTASNSNQFEIWNRIEVGDQVYNGVISGPLFIRRSATTANTGGRVIFNANNTYTGGTSLNDGEIALGSDCTGPAGAPTDGPLGTGLLTLGNDAGKLSASAAARTLKNRILFSTGGKTLTMLGTNNLELSGAVDLAAQSVSLVSSNTGDWLISGVITNGSMTKNGPGRLIFTGNNNYAGATLINAGTLALSGSGSVSNTPFITVAGGATFDVSGLSSAFTLGAAQTLSNSTATAVLAGNLATSSGTLALLYPGTTPFTVTNGTITLATNTVLRVNNTAAALGAGSYKLIAKTVAGNPGLVSGTVPASVSVTGGGTTGTPSLQIIAGELYLTVGVTTLALVSSSPTNGYLNLATFTATVRTNGVTAANATGTLQFFTNNVLFTTNGLTAGATNFSLATLPRGTNLITAIYSGDANYLASSNTLVQTVTNHPPAAGLTAYVRGPVSTWRLRLVDLATNAVDADGDTLAVTAFDTSTNGVTLTTNAGLVLYQNLNLVNDRFNYTVSDGYGGSATGSINLISQVFITGQNGSVMPGGSSANVRFAGIPGFSYGVRRSTNLVDWAVILTTNAPGGGLFDWTDDFNDLGSVPAAAYYQLQWNP